MGFPGEVGEFPLLQCPLWFLCAADHSEQPTFGNDDNVDVDADAEIQVLK